MDVVSFTFTTPLTRNNPGSETSKQAGLKTNGLSLDHHIKRVLLDTDSTRSPVRYNVIGDDTLGILLEQKLRELTYGVETPSHDSFKLKQPSSTAPKSKDPVPTHNLVNIIPSLQQKRGQDVLFTDKLCSSHHPDISFTGLPELSSKHKLWADETEEGKSYPMEAQLFNCQHPSHPMEAQLFNCQHPSPISVLEPSFSVESCESSVSTDASSTEGNKLCSSVEAQEDHGLNFSRKSYPAESDTEISDSASSSSTGAKVKEHTSTFSVMKFGTSGTWELDYVKDILCNVELRYIEFALGRAREIVNPHLFNQLEDLKGGFDCDGESRIRRKATFDCVSECLDLRCRRSVGGGYKMWAKAFAMVKRNQWLAEEVYKEISGWGGLGDSMVDELVDKDMSSQYGRWLDFKVDAFELGAEVEDQIFNSLVDDVVVETFQLEDLNDRIWGHVVMIRA